MLPRPIYWTPIRMGNGVKGGKLMNSNPKFIRVVSFGNPAYINVQYIESVIFIDGKTRICPACGNGYFETNESIEEVMKKIINI